MALIIQTILLDLSGAVWIDELTNLSRPDPSGAVQFDAEHPARNQETTLVRVATVQLAMPTSLGAAMDNRTQALILGFSLLAVTSLLVIFNSSATATWCARRRPNHGTGPRILSAAEVLEVRDGRIVRSELFYDAEELRRAQGPTG